MQTETLEENIKTIEKIIKQYESLTDLQKTSKYGIDTFRTLIEINNIATQKLSFYKKRINEMVKENVNLDNIDDDAYSILINKIKDMEKTIELESNSSNDMSLNKLFEFYEILKHDKELIEKYMYNKKMTIIDVI